MQDVAAKEPTCTEIGWKAYKRCAHYCGKTEGYEQIDKTGHNLSVRVARVEPTCEKWGHEEYYKCSNEGCNYNTDYNGLPALGHDKERHNPCEATCTEDGYWGSYYTCKREGCDYSSKVDRYVEKALGHNLKHYEAKQADCLPGWDEYDECQREGCDYNTKVEIPANGKHSYVCDVCTTCNECNPVKYIREGKYIYFGHWPQTLERDENVIAKLNEVAGTIPEYTIYTVLEKPENWSYYENSKDIWYIDVIYSGTKYRGFYMKEFRPAVYGSLGYSIISDNHYTNHQVYWFKVEPIKWRILTTSGNSAYIMSDIALDAFWLEPNRGEAGFYNGEYGIFRKDQMVIWTELTPTTGNIVSCVNGLTKPSTTRFSTICKRKSYRPRASTTAREVAIRTNTRRITRILTARKQAWGNKYAAQCKDTDDKIFCCL